MPARINRLTARSVAALTKPGRHADGQNLYLKISHGGASSWIFLYRFGGRIREMGLGSAMLISLAQAREKARECRSALAATCHQKGRQRCHVRPMRDRFDGFEMFGMAQ
jgi:hypothetical protein